MPKASESGSRKNRARPEEPARAAAAASLCYVSDREPGITRRRRGRGWSYHAPDGSLIRDEKTRERIASLAIPPAWSEVWVCPDPKGHLQATGRDDRGRKQYRYHPRWREVRDATKFHRMTRFGESLPAIRAGLEEALRKRSLSREKVLATLVRLLETSCIRIGNDEYARENGTYGLTTLRNRHVRVRGSEVRFRFEAKGGKEVEVSVSDRRVARVVRDCGEIPGYELFQYLDGEGERRDVKSEDVNAYLKELSGEDFTAKDFRTWIGTLHAFSWLCARGAAANESEAKKHRLEAVSHVAEQLRNTRAVCRDFYVHPGVLEAHETGLLCELFADGFPEPEAEHMDPVEMALLRLLRKIGKKEGAKGKGRSPPTGSDRR